MEDKQPTEDVESTESTETTPPAGDEGGGDTLTEITGTPIGITPVPPEPAPVPPPAPALPVPPSPAAGTDPPKAAKVVFRAKQDKKRRF